MIGIVIAFLCGAIVPFAVQAWVFHEQRKKERTKLKAFLVVLNNDLKEYFGKLFIGDLQYYCAEPYNLLINFKEFNTANKHAMWSELMKFVVFHKNLDIFGRINSIIHKIEVLNVKISICIPERHKITLSSIEVLNWRDLMSEIKITYVPKKENSTYEDSLIGSFMASQIKIL